ncbi:glycosyl transferase family 2 [Alteromonas sp. KS69]|jgi:glycosyltransferase involved in cell wall biosynthesis|nr:glycosyltransferase [Alteromonas sp. 154]RUP83449.1 glycosyl transferase family 2 [Alteromonas sp. KS69]CAD5265350.1 Glycosyl transferase family 2 [Alteromonas sp. 154]VXC11803.1 Glycosyl transferase family 2 [Alteromonas sp. 38]|tara:strand:- start:11662 stop:12585 length:924 start_codon:yes stop_codon:yes gene_type:complete
MEKVTIAIITCKRPIWLARLLDALQEQVFSEDLTLSILVVDNACDKETKDIVDKRRSGRIPIHYDVEGQAGIVYARNKCVSITTSMNSDYLIFIDDDEWPKEKTWASDLVLSAKKYAADIVTSHVISVDEAGKQNWATEILYPAPVQSEGQELSVFYTNNLLLSKHVLAKMSPCFDERFAMTGASDYHFALKCTHAGFRCIYTDAPVVEEMPSSRKNIKWFCRRGFRSGIGFTRSHIFEESLLKAVLKSSILSIVRVIRGVLLIVKALFLRSKGTLVDGLFRVCSGVGTFMGLFGVKHEEYKKIHGK